MRLKSVFLLVIFLVSGSRFSRAQQVGIGEWDSYFTLTNMYDVVEADRKIVWVSESSALYYDMDDQTLSQLNKIDGLTQTGFTTLAYNTNHKTIVFAYNDGNIDLVKFDANNKAEFYNMSDIKRSTLTGDKKIYHLYAYGDLVYVSCGFGIVVIDVSKREVKDTYLIGAGSSQLKINGVTIGQDTIYATTDNGIYKAYQHNAFLNYYTAWSKMTALPPWLVNKTFKQPAFIGGKLFIIPDYPGYGQDTSYYREGGIWYKTPVLQGLDHMEITPTADGNINLAARENITVYSSTFTKLSEIFTYNGTSSLAANAGLLATDGFFYVADEYQGPWQLAHSYGAVSLLPGGTYSSSVRRLTSDGNQLWVASGSVTGTIFLNTFNTDFFSIKEGNTWKYINEATDPLLAVGCYDAMDVAIDPTDPTHVMAAMWAFNGLAEIRNMEVVAIYDETNTPLFSPPGYPGFCGVATVEFDEDGNLWCLNGQSPNPLVVKTVDGNWHTFYCGNAASSRTYYDIVIDKNGYKYLPYPTRGTTAGGLTVYNDNGTIADPSDDQYAYFGPDYLTTAALYAYSGMAEVRCVTEDLDGEIWIGTLEGPRVIYNPTSIFTSTGASADEILIEQDGNTQILLESEQVNCIEVDGANRKWIGTANSGAFLLSEDGQEELFHFTSENSPLPTNDILDIEIDDKTGEVFFATSLGLISYRGTATGSNVVFDSVKVFPNPVRPGYTGPIAINGLSRNSDVKVTDIAGNIVNVIKSEGGQAVWDGTNLKGERVKPGIYMFLCSKEDGSSKVAGKVMFIE